jgi:hypothetical protein
MSVGRKSWCTWQPAPFFMNADRASKRGGQYRAVNGGSRPWTWMSMMQLVWKSDGQVAVSTQLWCGGRECGMNNWVCRPLMAACHHPCLSLLFCGEEYDWWVHCDLSMWALAKF